MTTTAGLVLGPVPYAYGSARTAEAPVPACGAAAATEFPLATRIHGGPAAYAAGGPLQAWRLDLTNTTSAPCTGIHPVLVLTDRDRERALRPEQIRAEFYDAEAARWRPLAFEATDEAENVGVFADSAGRADVPAALSGFSGFSVPPGRTLTVPVRLAFRAGTDPDEVVVNAAVVQRRGADGEWVGESDDYRLTVEPAEPGAPDRSDTTAPPGTPDPPGRPEGAATLPGIPPPGTDPGRDPAHRLWPPYAHVPGHELARTGGEEGLALAPVAAALALGGGMLVLLALTARRRRRTPPAP
ncbi:hypothetical protein [Streptomyces sp. NPDC003327]